MGKNSILKAGAQIRYKATITYDENKCENVP
jgi:hypothetical protein